MVLASMRYGTTFELQVYKCMNLQDCNDFVRRGFIPSTRRKRHIADINPTGKGRERRREK